MLSAGGQVHARNGTQSDRNTLHVRARAYHITEHAVHDGFLETHDVRAVPLGAPTGLRVFLPGIRIRTNYYL